MQQTLARQDVVLLGVGHTNAHVVRMWRMQPLPDARLTCISNFPQATYSGMLPGTLAGLYETHRMEIDLVRLCKAVGARLIVDAVTGIDRKKREVLFEDRAPIPYDVLSVGVGSQPARFDDVASDDSVIAIKPMQTLLSRLDARIREWAAQNARGPLRMAVIGAGVGGVEVALALPSHVRNLIGQTRLQIYLVDRHDNLAPLSSPAANRHLREALTSHRIELELGRDVKSVASGAICFDDGETLAVDIGLLTTAATAPSLLNNLELPRDSSGFLLTKPTLQSIDDDRIFGVGDSGTIQDEKLPKAGVYAVRQGPVLWDNIARVLKGEPTRKYRPQRGFLKLVSTGDGHAILSYGRLAARGRWCWRLKNWIDSRFMAKYQDYAPMEMKPPTPAPAMRCVGCGGKVGGEILRRVLGRLNIPPNDHVVLGLDQPDDAAIIRGNAAGQVAVTVDFFHAPLDDPYLVGRIAALNALSDAFAIGAKPTAALAQISIPLGPAGKQEQLLFELLEGALHEFRRHNVALAGGHTIEGEQLAIGFTVLANPGQSPRTKNQLRPNDQLILTKPLGTGILLAGWMRAELQAASYKPLLKSMLSSNATAAALFDEFDVPAVTDVTGFGLAGHLSEMLEASRMSANLNLASLPLLPGVTELVERGIESSLAPANRLSAAAYSRNTNEHAVNTSRVTPARAVIFDPQTSGGLLLGVAPNHVDELLARLRVEYPQAALIGNVIAESDKPEIICR